MSASLIIAHRGGDSGPENSLTAIAGAIAQGADGVEIDIMRTADALVLYHDFQLTPRFTRRKDGRALGEDAMQGLTRTQLRALDIFCPRAPHMRDEISDINEFCRWVADHAPRRFQFFVELKSRLMDADSAPIQRLAEESVAALKAHGLLPQTTLLSFDWRILQHVRRRHPQVAIACTSLPFALTMPGGPSLYGKSKDWLGGELAARLQKAARPQALWWGAAEPTRHRGAEHGEKMLRAMAAMGANAWCAPWQDVSPARQDLAQELGLKIFAWPVDRFVSLRRLHARKLDALITHSPALARLSTGAGLNGSALSLSA